MTIFKEIPKENILLDQKNKFTEEHGEITRNKDKVRYYTSQVGRSLRVKWETIIEKDQTAYTSGKVGTK